VSWQGKCWCGKTGFRKPLCYRHWIEQLPKNELCRCGGFSIYNNGECESCRQKRYTTEIRNEIVKEYGGKCKCCDESRWQFLTMDHIDGNGAKHRKELFGDHAHGGAMFYRWLKQQGFPKDNYRLLCYNCNCSIGFHGYCPHGNL